VTKQQTGKEGTKAGNNGNDFLKKCLAAAIASVHEGDNATKILKCFTSNNQPAMVRASGNCISNQKWRWGSISAISVTAIVPPNFKKVL